MIPKKIHYCWFSGRQMPAEFQRYIDSWKKYCPDYELIRWDESNYDVEKNAYMAAAYKEKRWGFVPDYARFDIIYKEGGIYLDTDVELIKSLNPLLSDKAFLGYEGKDVLNAGLGFGAEKGNPIIKELRDMYEEISFYNKDGSLNLTPSPYYITEKLKELGIQLENQYQNTEYLTVYPIDRFGCKDYNSGEIRKTENSFSIHHYSCSWMNREEKKAEERRRAFCSKYGDFWGNRVDGVYKRVRSLRNENKKKGQRLPERIREHFIYSEKSNEKRLEAFQPVLRSDEMLIKDVTFMTPAIKSVNLGDSYIEKRCRNELGFPKKKVGRVSTHVFPGKSDIVRLRSSDVVIVTGSNLLSGNMHHSQWKLPKDYSALSGVCLMGCGWSGYEEINDFSQRFYQKILNNGWMHSVRDRYTQKMLEAAGVEQVIYTACPTMWKLTKEHCAAIPARKGNAVVTALTSYQADPAMDSYQLQMLFDHYDRVYFWPQAKSDISYINRLLMESEKKRMVMLPGNLKEFSKFLKREKPDYIGNRLHAGIMALSAGCRAKIIAIDNRAIEIGKDTALPVIQREDLMEKLESTIYSTERTEVILPWDNIKRWKEQFRK